ncbi:MAG: LuxR C-terminal-related transcriptional regulator [Kineosporiaceae bacterium]
MPVPILATKLYAPAERPGIVSRSRLDAHLDDALHRRLTLVSAPAGFGKTTAIADWARRGGHQIAWLSLDDSDSDLGHFLTYLIAALRALVPHAGEAVLPLLDHPQPPPIQSALTPLVNDLAAATTDLVLVLDDYHSVDSRLVDDAVAFLVEHLPPHLHLIIASREDPSLPLGRLRAGAELCELRAPDLRFTTDECQRFLNGAKRLGLSSEEVAALESSTEGWIAGLQLVAISLEHEPDPAGLITSFSGSHRFVLDYLAEEVLARLPPERTRFLILTSVLDRLCGPLCDAVTLDATPGQDTLELLERSNLFIVPLDEERRWFRYHHLFRDLLRRRLQQTLPAASLDELHVRASGWLEQNGLDLDAFRHATAGHDIARAVRLIQGHGLPLYTRGALAPIAAWLTTLPRETLDAWPELRVVQATVMLGSGQSTGITEMLDQVEATLASRETPPDPHLLGRIANLRAMLGLSRHRADVMIAESRRALEYLPPDDVAARASAIQTLGYAHQVLGERAEARTAYSEARGMSRGAGSRFGELISLIGLGAVEELDTELRAAAATYEETLRLAADLPYPVIAEAHLGLARIHYEWNDLDDAWQRGQRALELARRLQNTDRPAACQVLLARIKLSQGAPDEAGALLEDAERWVRELGNAREGPSVMAALARLNLFRGRVDAASHIAEEFDLPTIGARVLLARGAPAAALQILRPVRAEAEARGWRDEALRCLTLEALASRAAGSARDSLHLLDDVMDLAIPQGFVRLFVDEGTPMADLLRQVTGRHRARALRLLGAFPTGDHSARPGSAALIEPLSGREREVLSLLAEGLSNQRIAERLYLSPLTVKVHLRTIYSKLGVGSRTQAVALGRGVGLIDTTGAEGR